MSGPVFLTLKQVQRLHQKSIQRFGGSEGIRDQALFESSVLHPQNVYYYAHGDLFDIAAAYAYHIAQAQAFFDGNKRTAVAAALTFLEGNGVSTDFDGMPIYQAMIDVVEKRVDKLQIASLLRQLAGK